MTDPKDPTASVGVRVVGWRKKYPVPRQQQYIKFYEVEVPGSQPLILAHDEAGWLEGLAGQWESWTNIRHELRTHAKELRGLK